MNIAILSYTWTKSAVILVGASEPPLRLTSVSFCGKPKTPIVAIGAMLSFNYVSIKPVMSSKSATWLGANLATWLGANLAGLRNKPSHTYSLLQECLLHVFHHRQASSPPPGTQNIHAHQTLSVYKNHIICFQANFCTTKTLDKHLGGSGFES